MVGLDELFHHGRNLLAPAPTAGVFSEGLKTTALPAISAGTICPFGKCAGKLYGPSTATAPCGLWRTALRSPIAPSMRRLAVRSAYALTEISTFFATDSTTGRGSPSGFPVSPAVQVASASPPAA